MNRNEYLHRTADLLFLEKQLAKPGLSKLSKMSIHTRIEQAKEFLATETGSDKRNGEIRTTTVIDLAKP